MQTISSRLVRLLDALLSHEEPVNIDAIAKMLGSSRRTIFRELENADSILSSYNLEIDSSSGKGICLLAGSEERENLMRALRKTGALRPGNRKERLLCLLLLLLSNDSIIQKLFFYADALGVSEATLSSDLDELENYLKAHHILLMRKPGQGVCAIGEEAEIRTAMTTALLRDGDAGSSSYSTNYGYPGDDIEFGVNELFKKLQLELDWLSAESEKRMRIFLMVSVERIKKGSVLAASVANTRTCSGIFQKRLADRIVGEIALRFSLEMPPEETMGIAVAIQSCRSKQRSPLEPTSKEKQNDLNALTFQMIELFDPNLAPVLKTDERLVNGLLRHLYPAITRIKNIVELSDPFQGQLDNQYPDLYEKSCKASKALEDFLGVHIPPVEVSFIAIHFYAALISAGEKNIRKRILKAGIVCVSGIGISHMVASQVRKRYKGELEIEICPWNDKAAFEKIDFIISTVPLNEIDLSFDDPPAVFVNAVFVEDDYQGIRKLINRLAFVKKTTAHSVLKQPLIDKIETVVAIMQKTQKLLDCFSVLPVDANISFDGLIDFCAGVFGSSTSDKDEIQKNLAARERMSSQVIREMNIVLLHTRTSGVEEAVFAVVQPQGGIFNDAYFEGANSCCVMLLPRHCPAEMTKIMGSISSALVDTPVFLDAVRQGNAVLIKTILEAELSDTLSLYCTEKLKT
jgi:mannitol operon transcriptional antiterminator